MIRSAATIAKTMLPAPHKTTVSDSVRARHRDAASEASLPRRTASSTAFASGVSPIEMIAALAAKKTVKSATIASAAPNVIRTTCVRKTYDSGPITTAGGTSSQMMYLREKAKDKGLYGWTCHPLTVDFAAMIYRAVAALLIAVIPLALAAQTPQTPRAIGEVTLFGEEQLKVEAATKTEIPISKAPNAVTVVTAKQISESGARTVPDLLRLVAGVNVRWNPMVQTIDIRGFGENPFSNRILLLIDGVPYNSGDTGGFPLSPGFDTFPIQNIKRIEIVRGPGSSLYGENAYWGVINIVTLSGDDLAGGDAQIFGGDRSTSSVNVQYGRKLKDGSILGSVRTLRSMFPMTFWIDDDSKFRATDIFLKGGYKDFQLSVYRHDDRLGGFEEHFAVSPRFPPGSQFASVHQVQQTLDIAQLKYNHAPGGAAVTYSADVSWSHRTGTLCAGCHAATQKPEFSQPANHGYQVIGDFRLGLHMIRGHDILFGAEGRRLNRAEHAAELAPNAAAVNGYDKFAIYAQDQFDVITNK